MPFVKALVGGLAETQGTPFTSQIQTSKVVSGGKGRIRWQGALPTVTAVTSETASTVIALDADRRGSAEFSLTHYHVMHNLSFEETVYAKGDNWVDDYMGEEIDSVLQGFWHKIATDVHGTGDQGAGSIGSLARAVDSDDDIGTYLGIARNDAANVNLRATTVTGAVTAANILDLVNDCMAQGGNPDMIIMSSSNYKTARAAADAAMSYNQGGPGADGFYGSKNLFLGNVPVLLDGYCSNSYVYILDTRSWQFQWDDAGIKASKPIRAETVESILVQHFDMFVGLACRQPRFNARLDVT